MRILPLNHRSFKEITFFDSQESAGLNRKINRVNHAIKQIELSSVEKNYRSAATLVVSKDNLESVTQGIRKRNLIYTPVQWIKPVEEYGHLEELTSRDDPTAMCYGVVTKISKVGELFKKASGDHEDHDTIGKMLGYPKCCREFFIEAWSSGYYDPIWQQALNTDNPKIEEQFCNNKWVGYSVEVEGYPQCVAMHRYWGVQCGFHLPCSFTCKATYELSKIWTKELNEIDQGSARDMLEILSLPTTWSASRGLAVVYTPHYKGITASVPCADLHTVHFTPIKTIS